MFEQPLVGYLKHAGFRYDQENLVNVYVWQTYLHW